MNSVAIHSAGVLGALLFTALISPSQAVSQPGGNIIGSEPYGRPWNYVDNSQSRVVIEGDLELIKFNTGPAAIHDWDCNIFIAPSEDSRRYARNVFGEVNPSIENLGDGRIECEVATLSWSLNDNPDTRFRDFFKNIFRIGAPVTAYGFWVQDWGHEPWSPKTELHPLIYLRQDGYAGTSLYVPRDVSERFFVSPPMPQTFHFDRHPQRDDMNVAATLSASAQSSASIMFERSMLDISTNKRSGLWRTYGTFPQESDFAISISLGPPDTKNTLEAGGHYHPFYLGQITEVIAPVYDDRVTLSIIDCQAPELGLSGCAPGHKVVRVEINATLSTFQGPGDNSAHGWALADWRLTKGNPFISEGAPEMERHQLSGAACNTTTFVRYYSPQLDMNNNEWLLAVGAHRSAEGLPPKAGSGPGTQAILYKERVYHVATSKIAILPVTDSSAPRVNLGTYGDAAVSYDLHCPSKRGQFLAKTETAPGVSVVAGSFKWEARRVMPASASGASPTVGPWMLVSPTSGPVALGDWTLQTDTSNPRLLVAEVDNSSPGQPWSPDVVELQVSEETEVGESIADDHMLRYGLCRLTGGPEEFMESVAKAFVILEYLRARGLLPDPIPDDFAKLFHGSQEVPWRAGQIAVLPEPEEFLPKLSGRLKTAVAACYRFFAGEQISRKELTLVAKLAAVGSKLEWNNKPPVGAFDGLGRRPK